MLSFCSISTRVGLILRLSAVVPLVARWVEAPDDQHLTGETFFNTVCRSIRLR